MGPWSLVSSSNDTPDELVRRDALLQLSTVPCSLSCIHSVLLSNWKRSDSLNLYELELFSVSTEEHVLPRHACCFVFGATDTASCETKIGRIESSLYSTCGHPTQDILSHSALSCNELFATLGFKRLLFTTPNEGLGELPDYWPSMVYCHAPNPLKRSGNNNVIFGIQRCGAVVYSWKAHCKYGMQSWHVKTYKCW